MDPRRPTRPKRARRRPRAETRNELLEAAARVFARQGLHGASVEAVSEEAGYSRGALYSNFESKEDLFLALYEERIGRRRRELREVMQRAGDPAAGLAPASANVMQALDQEREWFLLYFEFALHAARDAGFAEQFERVREQGLAELATGIAEGLEMAGLDSSLDPADLALALKALSYGLALERLVSEDGVPADLLGRVIELIFRGIRAEREAAGA
jgi:AcrR family transcriptional regulator